ncbi:MAG: acetyltransferase [Candidatus Bathyarchaeia archaeon]|jgi:sugar O-acyltransferase (sialic acid O-acetyltransferase NeuD family)
MAGNKEKLVIVGDGETAALAYDYFTEQSSYDVVGFSVEKAFLKNKSLFGLPVVAFEDITRHFDPEDCSAFVAVSYTQLNRLRSRLYQLAKAKGYTLATYISPHAAIARNVGIGDNCFILENVTVQRGAKIGNNVTLWSGTSIGHRTVVEDNCFFASHVAVSGFCEVGEGSFLGVNSCLRDKVHVGKDCIVGAGAVVIGDTVGDQVYVGNPAKPLPNKTVESFISGEKTI